MSSFRLIILLVLILSIGSLLTPIKAFGSLTIFGGLPLSPEKAAACRQFMRDLQEAEASKKNQEDIRQSKLPEKSLEAQTEKLKNQELTMLWYTPMELGDHDVSVARDRQTGIRRFLFGTFTSGGNTYHRDFTQMRFELMPDAEDGAPAYYARASQDLGTGALSVQLYSLNSEKTIAENIAEHLDLVWQTYLKENTVTAKEIEEFKKQETLLAPQRKMTFVLIETRTQKTLSVMRVYDGCPFPGVYFGDFGQIFDYREVNNKIPVERRYPKINFRIKNDYIFEAGRLAKDAAVGSALERQFTAFAGQLKEKFGTAGIVPLDYLDGRVYIEITGRNLKKFLKARNEDGYGFTLFKKLPVKKSKVGESNPSDQKYILYSTVLEFVNNFYGPWTVKPF